MAKQFNLYDEWKDWRSIWASEATARNTAMMANQAGRLAQAELLRARAEQEQMDIAYRAEQHELLKRKVRDRLFSMQSGIGEIMKTAERDPITAHVLLQRMVGDVETVPREALDDYSDKAFHAQLLAEARKCLADVDSKAPEKTHLFTQLLGCFGMMFSAGLAIDAFWEQMRMGPAKARLGALMVELVGLERKHEERHSSETKIGFGCCSVIFGILSICLISWSMENETEKEKDKPPPIAGLTMIGVGSLAGAVALGFRMGKNRKFKIYYSKRKRAIATEQSALRSGMVTEPISPCYSFIHNLGVDDFMLADTKAGNTNTAPKDFLECLSEAKRFLDAFPEVTREHIKFVDNVRATDMGQVEALVKKVSHVVITCPLCKKNLSFGMKAAGKQLECPKCKGQITLPSITSSSNPSGTYMVMQLTDIGRLEEARQWCGSLEGEDREQADNYMKSMS